MLCVFGMSMNLRKFNLCYVRFGAMAIVGQKDQGILKFNLSKVV